MEHRSDFFNADHIECASEQDIKCFSFPEWHKQVMTSLAQMKNGIQYLVMPFSTDKVLYVLFIGQANIQAGHSFLGIFEGRDDMAVTFDEYWGTMLVSISHSAEDLPQEPMCPHKAAREICGVDVDLAFK